MFEAVPKADAYSLKMILHDWNDAECVKILSNIRKAAAGPARVFIVEHVVPEHNVPHFSKLFDIHMMCWGTGQERTEAQYIFLLERAGWVPAGSYYPANRQMGVDRWRLYLSCEGRCDENRRTLSLRVHHLSRPTSIRTRR